MKQLLSSFLTLNKLDFIKGLRIAVVGAVLGVVYPTIQNWIMGTDWALKFDWHAVVKAAIGATFTYLTTKLVTNSQGQFFKAEPKG